MKCALADQYQEARNAFSRSLFRNYPNPEPKSGTSKTQQTRNDQKKPKDTQPEGKEICCHKCLRFDILQTNDGIETQLHMSLVKMERPKVIPIRIDLASVLHYFNDNHSYGLNCKLYGFSCISFFRDNTDM